MRAIFAIILVLQLLHLPVPCPDLDGECRGTPIESIADGNAWHLLITGVRPNSDIDRGPIHSGSKDFDDPLTQSPFGELTIVGSAHFEGKVNTAKLTWLPQCIGIVGSYADCALPSVSSSYKTPLSFDNRPSILLSFCVLRI